MSMEEKRGTLRSSGVRPPRKRVLSESEDKDRDLENLILPLMDEAVSATTAFVFLPWLLLVFLSVFVDGCVWLATECVFGYVASTCTGGSRQCRYV